MSFNERSEVLPDSRAKRHVKRVVYANGMSWVPVFCANCDASGGLVPEQHTTFAFYLCDPCFEKHGIPAGTMATPDEKFWAKVQGVMEEERRANLTPSEILQEIEEGTGSLALLAREKIHG